LSETNIYQEAQATLVEQCRKGSNEAFKELYVLYNKAMFNICMRMLNSREEAEDVLQESFISAFKNIRQYNGSASFGSWLKRIVINRCIDSIKKRNPGLVPIVEKDLPDEEPVEEQEITYTIESVKAGVAMLPDGYRIILSLYLFEDYNHKMIAEKLSISEGTSKSQYSRARKKLIEWITLNSKKS
jgi:RNA polymerase sigma factor (sigma-70 family)